MWHVRLGLRVDVVIAIDCLGLAAWADGRSSSALRWSVSCWCCPTCLMLRFGSCSVQEPDILRYLSDLLFKKTALQVSTFALIRTVSQVICCWYLAGHVCLTIIWWAAAVRGNCVAGDKRLAWGDQLCNSTELALLSWAGKASHSAQPCCVCSRSASAQLRAGPLVESHCTGHTSVALGYWLRRGVAQHCDLPMTNIAHNNKQNNGCQLEMPAAASASVGACTPVLIACPWIVIAIYESEYLSNTPSGPQGTLHI